MPQIDLRPSCPSWLDLVLLIRNEKATERAIRNEKLIYFQQPLRYCGWDNDFSNFIHRQSETEILGPFSTINLACRRPAVAAPKARRGGLPAEGPGVPW